MTAIRLSFIAVYYFYFRFPVLPLALVEYSQQTQQNRQLAYSIHKFHKPNYSQNCTLAPAIFN
jgi:hypothetical protein